MNKNYGYQCISDSLFTRKARLLQSLYRMDMNEEEGKGPSKSSKDPYGNMISNGDITGKNFFLPETFQYAKERVGNRKPEETFDEFRLFNNLLSSMPMAFNLFHPLMLMLKENPVLATSVIQSSFKDFPIAKVTEIGIEFIPTPIDKYTHDKSAMDAYIKFTDCNDRAYIIAIETKYTDSLGTNEAKGIDKQKELFSTLGIFTNSFLDKIKHGEVKISQIYRNILLTERYRIVENLEDSYSIILSPAKYPSTKREIQSVYKYLPDDKKYKLQALPLEDFVENLITGSPDFYRNIFIKFKKRYLDFERADKLLKEGYIPLYHKKRGQLKNLR